MKTKPGPISLFLGRSRNNVRLYDKVSKMHLHSDRPLEQLIYQWTGCLPASEVNQGDIPVSVDARAFCQRSQKDGRVVKLRTGTYSPQYYPLKLFGIIRSNQLLLILKEASERICDIAPLAPMRTAGVRQAVKMFRTICSRNAQQDLGV